MDFTKIILFLLTISLKVMALTGIVVGIIMKRVDIFYLSLALFIMAALAGDYGDKEKH